jgi:ArsR family transcriptional regulator, lead/cadmium/zinc/bismuth-responsive transcriptional repressor
MPSKIDILDEMETCGCRLIHHERVAQARAKDIPARALSAMTNIFKAMGDPTRLRILHALLDGEMCVCDLAALAGVSESAVSHQLRRLRDLNLVSPRRQGQMLFYSLNDQHVELLLQVCREHVEH